MIYLMWHTLLDSTMTLQKKTIHKLIDWKIVIVICHQSFKEIASHFYLYYDVYNFRLFSCHFNSETTAWIVSRVMVFNATFNNISVRGGQFYWLRKPLIKLSHMNVVLSTHLHEQDSNWKHFVLIGSCKSNFYDRTTRNFGGPRQGNRQGIIWGETETEQGSKLTIVR